MKIGLFFGSFNPIHQGHLMVANYMVSRTDLDQIWFVVSPQNPFKESHELAPERHRLKMVQYALKNGPSTISVSDVEFGLPKPSYTIRTLGHLSVAYPKNNFVLVCGGDILDQIPQWKEGERIIQEYQIYVYARPGSSLGPLEFHNNVTIHYQVPQMLLSSTYLRQCIADQMSITYMTPQSVIDYISRFQLYSDNITNVSNV